MTDTHDIRFRTLDAMAALEREVADRLGFGPARLLTVAQEEVMAMGAEAAVEAWQDATHAAPDLKPRNDLERLCAEFIRLHDMETASRSH